jgi:hypothetical protein
MPKGACQAKIRLPLRSLREQPFDLSLGFAKSALSQNDGSAVARHRHLAARTLQRVANTPRPHAGFAVPNLIKRSVVNLASQQQCDRAAFDLNVRLGFHVLRRWF